MRGRSWVSQIGVIGFLRVAFPTVLRNEVNVSECPHSTPTLVGLKTL
jgi:hypothetical protein